MDKIHWSDPGHGNGKKIGWDTKIEKKNQIVKQIKNKQIAEAQRIPREKRNNLHN